MNYKIKELRREVGLSQYELAEVSKVPRYKVQLTEQGIACLAVDELTRILKMLGLKYDPSNEWMNQLIDNEACHE